MFKIYDGRDYFYQWDINQKLIISDNTITEVHFCNRTDDCSLVCEVYEENGSRVVDVPNILLQNSWDIRAYAYCDGSYTKHSARFEVSARSKPADYVYTETEIKNYEALEKRVDALEAGGGGGGSIVVDQEFDATSPNAQSGVAIGGVIGDIETALDGIIALQNNYITQAVSE